MEDPLACLHTSSTLISEAIKSFGFEIVVRSGEPAVSYNVFKDPFSAGTKARRPDRLFRQLQDSHEECLATLHRA